MIDQYVMVRYRGHRAYKYRCETCGASGFSNVVTAMEHWRKNHEKNYESNISKQACPVASTAYHHVLKTVKKFDLTRLEAEQKHRVSSQTKRTRIAVARLAETVQKFLDMVG